MLAWAVLSLMALGIGLLAFGRRGRRIDDHPVCRRCRFDLVGVYPAVGACPECGMTLHEPDRVRIGQRRKRPGFVVVGAILTALCVTGVGGYIWLSARGADLNRYKPVWVLRLEAEDSSAARADVALTELLRRSDAGELSAGARRRLAESTLLAQADNDTPWNVKWGDLLEAAWIDGVLKPEQVTRYARGGVKFSLRVRPSVAQGAHLPALVEVRSRVGTRRSLQCHLINYGMRLDDDPADPPEVVNKGTLPLGIDTTGTPRTTPFFGPGRAARPQAPPAESLSRFTLSQPLAAALHESGDAADQYGRVRASPGEHRARARFIVSVRPTTPGALWASWSTPAPLPNRPNWDMPGWAVVPMPHTDDLASWRVEVNASVRVLAPGESDVQLTAGEDITYWIGRGKIEQLRWNSGTGVMTGTLMVPSGPLDLAVEVWARVGDNEFLIGPAVIRSVGTPNPSPAHMTGAPFHGRTEAIPEGTKAVDIVVRASRRVAMATLDLTKIWDGEVTVPDVPLTVVER